MSDEKVESAVDAARRLLPCQYAHRQATCWPDPDRHGTDCLAHYRPAVAEAIEAAVARERESKPPQKMFPMQDSSPIPWELAERAYATYVKHGGRGQSLGRLAERGGFGLQEFACFFHGHYPNKTHTECVEKADSVGQLIARLQANLATAEAKIAAVIEAAKDFDAAEYCKAAIPLAEQRGREAACEIIRRHCRGCKGTGTVPDHRGEAEECQYCDRILDEIRKVG